MDIAAALQKAGIQKLDAELLLAHVLRCDRADLFAHPEQELLHKQEKQFAAYVKRRKRNEPLAYILGEKEFYGRMFSVNEHTLIPRPSTEGLTELALAFLATGKEERRTVDTGIVAFAKTFGELAGVRAVIDIGTGSGCIAITLALEQPDLRVIATDTSKAALETAEKNAARHGVSIEFLEGNLLEPIAEMNEPFVVVSNPPYIPQAEKLMEDVQAFEPHSALFAGADGTDVLAPLIVQARAHPLCRGVVIECREEQAPLQEVRI